MSVAVGDVDVRAVDRNAAEAARRRAVQSVNRRDFACRQAERDFGRAVRKAPRTVLEREFAFAVRDNLRNRADFADCRVARDARNFREVVFAVVAVNRQHAVAVFDVEVFIVNRSDVFEVARDCAAEFADRFDRARFSVESESNFVVVGSFKADAALSAERELAGFVGLRN